MPATKIPQLSDTELLDSLRAFPDNVLPFTVLRELAKRGPQIQDEIMRRIDRAARIQGIGDVPGDVFFCYGLLLSHPCVKQLPLLERVLRLDSDKTDRIAGELLHSVPRDLVVELGRTSDRCETLAWLDRMLLDESNEEWFATSFCEAIPVLVREECIRRDEGINRLLGVLRHRSNRKYDNLSTFALIALGELAPKDVDGFIRECFDRNQINDEIYALNNWENRCCESTPGEPVGSSPDLVDRLQHWSCFPRISYSLNPADLSAIEPNPILKGKQLTPSEVETYILAIRGSNDQNFPREAFRVLNGHVLQVRERLIEELRSGLSKVGTPEVRSSNGPFLSLVLLTSRDAPIPRDLVLSIVDLPTEQSFDLFGDVMDDAIAFALSSNLQGDLKPIEERILDKGRSDIDRYFLARSYLLSAYQGVSTRDETIHGLFRCWRETSNDDSPAVSNGLLELLCMMAPSQHYDTLRKHIDETETGNPQRLREFLDDPLKGLNHVDIWWAGIRHAQNLVDHSVMFDKEALEPERKRQVDHGPHGTPHPIERNTAATSVTVRNTTPTAGRNDTCPCGSGKKYKKCCLRK